MIRRTQLEIWVQMPCPVYMASALRTLRSAEHLDKSWSRCRITREQCGSYNMWVLFWPGIRSHLDFLNCSVQARGLLLCGVLGNQVFFPQISFTWICTLTSQHHPSLCCLAGWHEPGSEKHARASDPPLPGEGHKWDEHQGHGGASPGLLSQLQRRLPAGHQPSLLPVVWEGETTVIPREAAPGGWNCWHGSWVSCLHWAVEV